MDNHFAPQFEAGLLRVGPGGQGEETGRSAGRPVQAHREGRMKVSVVVAGLVWPVLAFGQQLYTNADLAKFDVPGAYTNDDLRRLPPLAVQSAPAVPTPPYAAPAPAEGASYQANYDNLKLTRMALAGELDFELNRIAFSEAAFAGNTSEIEPRLGYRSRVSSLVLELKKRVALLDQQMDDLAGLARRAGVAIDPR
ncbi:MAG: hypothetical protein AUI47_12435 [Acidobacteria bacterium 13_1_40CM_2_68_5]|nr:MAG: hypothetical protein AUI47_12435 [Acidobacteria bacterium 13_1_40CM_2_68_5]OLE67718.1 MAG: hypothetical protein AUG09_01030 [Acidobacteria bacterium 13_1_20CM_2_68_7]